MKLLFWRGCAGLRDILPLFRGAATKRLIVECYRSWHRAGMPEDAYDEMGDSQGALAPMLVFILLGVLVFFVFVRDVESASRSTAEPVQRHNR